MGGVPTERSFCYHCQTVRSVPGLSLRRSRIILLISIDPSGSWGGRVSCARFHEWLLRSPTTCSEGIQNEAFKQVTAVLRLCHFSAYRASSNDGIQGLARYGHERFHRV